jgi:hypothetical protein
MHAPKTLFAFVVNSGEHHLATCAGGLVAQIVVGLYSSVGLD